MRIIIVGCGRVGRTLALQLQDEEDSDLTLIDISAERLSKLPDELDALTVHGNGASLGVLMEAGIEECDLLIAVTNSDELNLLCCLVAQKTGHCATVARVRNPIFSKEFDFIKQRLGINMIINPEYAAALEIANLHRLPSAIKVDTFSRGRMELIKVRVLPEFGIDGMSVLDVVKKFRLDVLICGIESKDDIVIPGGSDVVHNGDLIYFLSKRENSSALFQCLGIRSTQVKTSLIVGGGTTAYYLARNLLSMSISVKIIEKNKERCEQLSELLPEAIIINGDGTDRNLLLEEGLPNVGSLVCLTNLDEENIFLTLYGRKKSSGKMVAKINRLEFDDVFEDLDIGSLIYPKYLTADYILSYVRALKNASGSNVDTLYHIMENHAEALEFVIRDNSPVLDIPLSELKLKSNTLVGCITRGNKVRIPRGQDTIQIGDTVIIVTAHKGLNDIRDILA